MDQTQMSRKEREKQLHREEILDAALSLFSSKGFHNVSMQDIANASEFGVGTIYNFFPGKDSLFEELMNRTCEQVLSEFSEILDGEGSEKERLADFIRHQPEFQQKHGREITLYLSEVGVQGSKLKKVRDEDKVHEVLDATLASVIESGINKGVFRKVDPMIAAKALASTTETVIFETIGKMSKQEATVEFVKVEQLFLGGLLNVEVGSNE
jgi:AcrR family transcriptional regulator